MYINLESYKKSGEARLTPVQIVEEGGVLYFRTGPRKRKVARIRRNPHVRIVPCSSLGNPRGTWIDGEAQPLTGQEYERANMLFKKEYGGFGDFFRMSVYGLLRGERPTTIISIRPHN